MEMKPTYIRFRIALMAFALGLAAVYMADRLPGTPYVELPTAVSTGVLPLFIANTQFFTREMNCGKDPTDAQARLDCVNEKVFENRDLLLYARYEIDCLPWRPHLDRPPCGVRYERDLRTAVSRHWKEKTRAYIEVRFLGNWWGLDKAHYFIEPDMNGSWQLTSTEEGSRPFFIDGERTPVTLVGEHQFYNKAGWKIATRDDGPTHLFPGTRYLEFENISGDTLSF